MNRADITDLYGDDEPNILFAEGFDEAIAGVSMGRRKNKSSLRHGTNFRVTYGA
jgi:hypothetical protein